MNIPEWLQGCGSQIPAKMRPSSSCLQLIGGDPFGPKNNHAQHECSIDSSFASTCQRVWAPDPNAQPPPAGLHAQAQGRRESSPVPG
jgi:hypothetical protein